jgi:TRAP-type C4-dicarboxylate transport system permease small subunit
MNLNDVAKNVFLIVSMAALAVFVGFTIYAIIFGASILDPVYPETSEALGWLNFRSFLVGCIVAYVFGIIVGLAIKISRQEKKQTDEEVTNENGKEETQET